jgi:hypothetical protein
MKLPRGGVKFSKLIKGAKTRSYEPSVDDAQIMTDFRMRELSTNSSNSMVLVATLKPDRDIMLRSQCGLPQHDAVDCLENVPETQFCLKLAIIDDRQNIDLYLVAP